tara:strand:+ start:184 stop:747 length:564 start_codon:yes stop_codon:yes gene_type:complete
MKKNFKKLKNLILKEIKNIEMNEQNVIYSCVSNMQALANGASGQLEGYLIPSPPQSYVTNAVNRMKMMYGEEHSYLYGTTSSGLSSALGMYGEYGCTSIADPDFYEMPPGGGGAETLNFIGGNPMKGVQGPLAPGTGKNVRATMQGTPRMKLSKPKFPINKKMINRPVNESKNNLLEELKRNLKRKK